MRSLKFRAWDNVNKIYLRRIVNISYDMAGQLHHVDGEQPNRSDLTVLYDKLLLEQYTGLKDKNGKEIYEGDIVKGEMGVFEVRWYDAIASFCFKPNIGMKWHPNCNQGTTDSMEVVGNIHENPELLEDKND